MAVISKIAAAGFNVDVVIESAGGGRNFGVSIFLLETKPHPVRVVYDTRSTRWERKVDVNGGVGGGATNAVDQYNGINIDRVVRCTLGCCALNQWYVAPEPQCKCSALLTM